MSELAKCLHITSSVPWKSTIFAVVSSNSDYRTASNPPPNVVQRALVSAQTALQGPEEPRGPRGLFGHDRNETFCIIMFLVPPSPKFMDRPTVVSRHTVFSSLPIIDLFTAEVGPAKTDRERNQGVEEMRKRRKKTLPFLLKAEHKLLLLLHIIGSHTSSLQQLVFVCWSAISSYLAASQ